jgi:small subunit ribosomal protein S6
MRQYEVVYIIDPQLEEDQQNALVERFQTLIRDNGGEIQLVDRWERRRMAYEIKGRREGYYVVMNFQGTQATEAELTRVFGITDGVLRSMIVRMDERRADKAIAEAKAAAEAKAKAQEEARVAAEAAAAAEAKAAAEAAAAAPAVVEAPAEAAPAVETVDAPTEESQGQDDTATGTVQEATDTES